MVAFGRIIPVAILDQLPMINVHFSLLPRWRGAAPVERAILAGDTETGVCLMQVAAGLVHRRRLRRRVVPLDDEITLSDFRAELVDVACDLLVEQLTDGLEGLPQPEPQHGEVTVAEKITKEDLHLDWSRPAVQLHRVVRLEHASTTFRGKRLGVLEVRAVDPGGEDCRWWDLSHPARCTAPWSRRGGVSRARRVQPESRSPM